MWKGHITIKLENILQKYKYLFKGIKLYNLYLIVN